MIVLFIGIFLVIRGRTTHAAQQSRQRNLGLFFILFAILSTQAAWLIVCFGILFFLQSYFDKDKQGTHDFSRKFPWKKKEFVSIDSLDISPDKSEPVYKKMTWLGRDDIGKNAFEWDDINFTKIMGETVIDLGNTILPNKENTIIIRKGIGNTRILIPAEAGVTVNYSTFLGKFKDEKVYQLKNEQIRYIEDNYSEKPRKLHIVVNVLVGDLEVISL